MDAKEFSDIWDRELNSQDKNISTVIEKLTGISFDDQMEMQNWIRQLMDEFVSNRIEEVRKENPFGLEHGIAVDIGDIFFGMVAPSIVVVTAAIMRDNKPAADTTSLYLSAVMAENKVREYLASDVDLGVIYPVDVVKDVTTGLDPVESFMVGVVAGGKHG